MLEVVLLSLLLLFLTRRLLFIASYPKGFPPGPGLKLPIFGNMLDISKPDILSGLENLRQRFGNIYGFYLGQQPTVLVSDTELIKKIAADAAVNEKKFVYGLAEMQGMVIHEGQKKMAGVLLSSDANWKDQRNFTLSALKILGKQQLLTKIVEETEILCDKLKGSKGKPVEVASVLRLATVNAFWVNVTGKRISHDDTAAVEVVNGAHKVSQMLFNPLGQLILTTKAFYWVVRRFCSTSPVHCIQQRAAYVKQEIKEHEKTFNTENIRDLMDLFIEKNKCEKDPFSSFNGENGRANMEATLMNLFSASNTLSAALTWCFLYMVLYPDVQAKVQEELDSLDNELTFPEDQAMTPFTAATITEVLRIAAVVPQGSRIASQDVSIGSHIIPKGSKFILNYHHANRDRDIFQDPKTFNPERFMDDEGNFVQRYSGFPFGYGKRRCLGESFSRMALYLFFTRIVRNFEICKVHLNDYDSEKPVLAFVMSPQPFQAKFIARK